MPPSQMECTACHKELPLGSRFCNYCGAAIECECPRCGCTPPSGSRFCNACGHDLTSVLVKSGPATCSQPLKAIPAATPDPERRHLTVMFCDLVDSTKLARGLDPEDLRNVVCSYQEICTAVIERYQGHIAQYLGDGLLIYFGYPHAHDDDTERALRAGLEILEELELLNVRLQSEGSSPLAVRIGVHTGNVVVQVPAVGMLMVLTYSPEFEPPWSMRSHTTPIVMSRLNRRHSAEMISSIAGADRLSKQTIEGIIAKTDGVPLFVEELTKSVLESDIFRNQENSANNAKKLVNFAIPETLQDSLRARLDSLSPVKSVIELCAMLGREFSYTLLEAISPLGDVEREQGLARLVEAELLYQRGLPPSSTYVFKPALIQDVAYQSLLKSRRRQFHKQIAEVLIDRFPEAVETQPELIAHHCTEAKLYEPAIDFWYKAGKRALEHSANVEAVSHLTNGLDAIEKLPEHPPRIGEELMLLTSLGTALIATKGYQAPEAEKTFIRAQQLCEQLGDAPQLFPVQYGLWTVYLMKAEREKTLTMANELVRLSQDGLDPARLVDSNNIAGVTAFFQGNHTKAHDDFENSLTHYDAKKHRSSVYAYGRDAGVMSQVYGGWNLWYLGHADQALERTTEAIALARKLGHLHTLVGTLLIGAYSHAFRRESGPTLELCDEGVALAKEHGFSMWEQHGTTIHAAGLLLAGKVEEAIEEFRRAEAIRESTGIKLLCPNARATLADACLQAGRPDEAIKEIEYGLEFVRSNLDCSHAPELHRLMGEAELAASPSNSASAEDCFNRAIDVARAHHAKAFEL